MSALDRIELNPKVCNGRPVIRGTRIPVSVILEQIAEGESWESLLEGYPISRIEKGRHSAGSSLCHGQFGAHRD